MKFRKGLSVISTLSYFGSLGIFFYFIYLLTISSINGLLQQEKELLNKVATNNIQQIRNNNLFLAHKVNPLFFTKMEDAPTPFSMRDIVKEGKLLPKFNKNKIFGGDYSIFVGVNDSEISFIFSFKESIYSTLEDNTSVAVNKGFLRFVYQNTNGSLYKLIISLSEAGLTEKEKKDYILSRTRVFFTDDNWTTSRIKLENREEKKAHGTVISIGEIKTINVRIPLVSKNLRPISPNITKPIGVSWIKKDSHGPDQIKTTYTESMGHIHPAYNSVIKELIDYSSISEELDINEKQVIKISFGDKVKFVHPKSIDSVKENTKKGWYRNFLKHLRDKHFPRNIQSKSFPIFGEAEDKMTLQVFYPTDEVIKSWLGDNKKEIGRYILLVLLLLSILFFSYLRAIKRLDSLALSLRALSKDISNEKNSTFNLITKEHIAQDEIGDLSRSIQTLLSTLERKTYQLHLEVKQKSLISAQIGHEILSPLQSLLGIVGEDENGKRKINRIMRAIKQIQEARNIEEAFQDVVLKEIKINDYFSSLCNPQQLEVENICFEKSKEQIVVEMDPEGMEDVFDNIINNAERYRKKNTNIEVKIINSRSWVKVTIFNKGRGIPEENLQKIFDYHFTTNEGKDNMGQGLFLAKTKITAMGGKVYAENNNNGVKVTIKLQIKRNEKNSKYKIN